MSSWKRVVTDLGSGMNFDINDFTGEVHQPSSESEEEYTLGKPVYEVTPHRFRPLKSGAAEPCVCSCCGGTGGDDFGECPLCDGQGSFQDDVSIERLDLWPGDDDSAFLLKNLLSSAECDEIIAQAESFSFRGCGYSSGIRVTDRVSVMGEKLGELLFQRARLYLADVSIPGFRQGPEGVPDFLMQGRWQPLGLNPCYRVCRYRPGGFFLPHYDGGFDYSMTHRSIKTCMLYLNDDFDGGPTNFYDENQARYRQGQPENLRYSLRPEKGSCLVFNHCITHDGGMLFGGQKYILRTEVMYRHVPSAA